MPSTRVKDNGVSYSILLLQPENIMRPDLELIQEAVRNCGGNRPAARFLKDQGYEVSENYIRRRLVKTFEGAGFTAEQPPEVDIDDLLEVRRQIFEKKLKKHDFERIRPISITIDGPIGIGFMGDPHIDSDGCNIKRLLEHQDLFDGRHEGLFAGCLGDISNNWQGRLARLWADQTTDGAQARALTEYFVQRIRWLFFVFGNHDLWADNARLIEQMLMQNAAVVRDWRVRLGLKFPNGRALRIYVSHRFPGRSERVNNYGTIKAALNDGTNDIYVAGDRHVSGYSFGRHPGTRRIWHAVQVGTYKEIDGFGDEIGAEDHNLYQCPVALIDPYATDEINFVRFEFDPHEGADRLKWMRRRWKNN